MEKGCGKCKVQFQVTDEDRKFYEKIDVPDPSLCQQCREQRRLAFRNDRNLFKRKCDLCEKDIVAAFKGDVPFPVYCNDCWWSDKWDPFKYGQEFDPSKPFFDQFEELLNKVPKVGLLQLSNENSEFSNYTAYSKNTYLSEGSYYMEDCFYTRKSRYCKDCLNSNFLDHCELINDSTNCHKCYSSHNLLNCRNCSDCGYMADSAGCTNCFMCSGIANKKFHYKNKQYSEEEYRKIVKEEMNQSTEELMKEFKEFNKTVPKKYQNQLNCENSSGDYIQNCKNATECYDSFEIEDAKYVIESFDLKDSMDTSMHDKNNILSYEISAGGESNYKLKFSFCSCASPESSYVYSCFYLSDSFGCDGIHSKQKNCILNKKYSEEEYEDLKKSIIEHMQKTEEWGEYFPMRLSPYPYNHTVAQDFYPINREEAMKNSCKWEEKDEKQYLPATAKIPDNIHDVVDNIIKETLACEDCGKNYRVIAQELKLCKKLGLALSKKCADCRQSSLRKLKNPRKLWDRKCDKCNDAIQTTYAPDRPETVYCEKCYLKEVY